MRKMPALATALLLRFGPQDDSFVGDLAEEYSGGRSRSWFWRQVLAAIALASVRHIGAHPLRTVMAVATGWATLLLCFSLGDRVAGGLAGWLWGWDRQTAYQTGLWWPFAICAWMVSYAGFIVSAVTVARVHRRQAGPMLMAYAASMLVALAASAVIVEVLSRLWDNRVPVPHTLFYVVSVALPYHWRSGLVLAPATILVAGLLADRRSSVGDRGRLHRLISALVVLTLYSASPAGALAQNGREQAWAIQPTDHFDIHYQSQQRSHVDAVAREAERAYARISYALRHELAAKMPLILVGQDRDLPRDERQARVLVTASRASERDHLFLSAETFEKRPGSALAHELTHQFVFELLPQADRDAPWVSEALADHHGGLWDSSELVRVRDAMVHGSVPAVEVLTAKDRHWGHAVFDFVAAEYGAQGIREYLAALRRGPRERSDAIRLAFGVSPHDFNAAFQGYLGTRFVDR